MRFRPFINSKNPAFQFPDELPTGALNKITDVPGLAVGHHTIIQDSPVMLRTGVSVLEIDGIDDAPVPAACHVFNGFGKAMGLLQVQELGVIESPVYLTNTLSIGSIHQGAVREALRRNPSVRTYNPVVLECHDGQLSDIRALAVTPDMAGMAHANATRDFELGSIGAGTGMVCFGFKGGIGSASRRIEVEGRSFHLGSLVLTNFGRQQDLRIPGLNRQFSGGTSTGAGSLIMIVATDLPLMPHQLERIARHTSQAIGILGAPGHHGSGDFVVAFSTTGRTTKAPLIQSREAIADQNELLNVFFRAAVWSTVEAILDSMLESPTMVGLNRIEGLLEALGTDSFGASL